MTTAGVRSHLVPGNLSATNVNSEMLSSALPILTSLLKDCAPGVARSLCGHDKCVGRSQPQNIYNTAPSIKSSNHCTLQGIHEVTIYIQSLICAIKLKIQRINTGKLWLVHTMSRRGPRDIDYTQRTRELKDFRR